MRRALTALTVFVVLATSSAALAQTGAPRPPSNLTATDRAWDNGSGVDLRWTASPDDASVRGYLVRQRQDDATTYTLVDVVPAGTTTFTVGNLHAGTAYRFDVAAVGADGTASTPTETSAAVVPTMDAFDTSRLWFLGLLVSLCGSVLAFIALARRGMPMRVREIAGLASITDAVGRATEMGRPCLFVPGILDMNDLETIAGVTMLERVAATVAEYDAKIEVPTSKSLVMLAGREALQAAFASAGRPENYSPDDVYYVTDEQFGYVAYLQGLMTREKPAACFYLGGFFAESLILAETGNGIGAIQIAGTAQVFQLPFFVAACDYTLIGEEFLAASAYLSGEPDQLGTLKGQDVGKIVVAAGILFGTALATIVSLTGSPAAKAVLTFFTEHMLQ